jgi:hypothetical protein
MTRSPIELLGAILDEIEGLKRTDSRIFLPPLLVLEMRSAINGGSETGEASNSQRLTSVHDLEGRTIANVFDCGLRIAQLLLLCTDGSFLALETEGFGDDTDIVTSHYRKNSIEDYLSLDNMVEAGLMTLSQKQRMEKEEAEKKAQEKLYKAKAAILAATAELEKLQAQGQSA